MFESLECMERDVATAAEADLYLVDRGDLSEGLIRLRRLIRRLEAFELALTRAHDHRQAWKDDGAHSAKQWHRDRRGMTPGQAARQVRTANDLAHLPKTAEKVANGDISVDQAALAAKATVGLPRKDVDDLDALVARTAPDGNLTDVRNAVTEFSHGVEPETLADRERLAHDRRGIRLSKCADGGVWIEGRLDLLAGEAALTATSALTAPKGDDDRTPDQRLADAIGDIFVRALKWEDLPADGGRQPSIGVTVDWETLQGLAGARAAHLEHQGPMSGELARQLACDADIHRIITRGASEILDLGRTTRVVSAALRRALVARDRGCVGCGAPSAWTDAHHIIHWADGGPTELTNLVLLCRSCHTGVHHRNWRVTRRSDGTSTVTRPPRATGTSHADSERCNRAADANSAGEAGVRRGARPAGTASATSAARAARTTGDDQPTVSPPRHGRLRSFRPDPPDLRRDRPVPPKRPGVGAARATTQDRSGDGDPSDPAQVVLW